MTFHEAVARIARRLEAADLSYGQGFENAHDEALRIAYAGAALDPAADISTDSDRPDFDLEDGAVSRMDEITGMRIASRRPLAYILNEAWFCGSRFYVDERAIIPRSYLAEWIPERFQPWVVPERIQSVLDLCCGTGCVAICCAMAFPHARIVASDLSADALEVASMNVADHGLEDRIRLNRGSGFEGMGERFDLIVCNPPYVSKDRMSTLPDEYRHEPEIAFAAGADGLDFILPMLAQASGYLTSRGIIVVESGSASERLEQTLDGIPFIWLGTEFDEKAVFLLEADRLKAARDRILKLLQSRTS